MSRHDFAKRAVWPAGLTALATILAAPGLAAAAVISQNLDFQALSQPIWSGAAPEFNAVLASTTIGPSLSAPFLLDFGPLGQYGAEANFQLGINVGLNTRLTDFEVGTVDVAYPVSVAIDVPHEVAAGHKFTISSSFSVLPTAGFQASTAAAQLDLGAKTGLVANLDAKACFGGCFLDQSFVDVNQPFGTLQVITQTQDQTVINVDVPGFGKPTFDGNGIFLDNGDPLNKPLEFAVSQATNVSGKVSVPDHVVTGSLGVGGLLSSFDTDVFTDVNVDLDGFTQIGRALGIDPITIGPLTFGYNILDATLNTKLLEQQALSFAGTPTIHLDAGPLGTFEFMAGESIELVMPEEGLDLAWSYSLDNVFTNSTAVAAAQAFVITAGQLILDLPSFQITPDIAPIKIPGTPSFCLVPNPFGGCLVTVPAVAGFTIPGVDGLEFPGLDFNGTAFQKSFGDNLLQNLAGISIDTCDVQPAVCDLLPLFGESGAAERSIYQSSYSLPFDVIAGSTVRVAAVPEPAALVLLGLALTALGFGRYQRRSVPALA